jgi:hypothetical protein
MICAAGYTQDAMLLAMQKYLHKRQPAEMLWCATQIYDLGLAEGRSDEEKQKGKAVLTHLWNQLIVLLDEDIVFDECVLYNEIRSRIDILSGGSYQLEALQEICGLMCRAKMIRLNADICAYWEKYTVGTLNIISNQFIAKPGDPLELSVDMNAFIHAIEERSPTAYKWALKIFHYKDIKSAHRYRRPEPVYAVWEYILSMPMHPEIKKTLQYRLQEFHKKERPERKIFLTTAVSIAIHIDSIAVEPIPAIEPITLLYDLTIDDSLDTFIDEDKRYFVEDWRDFCMFSREKKKKISQKKVKIDETLEHLSSEDMQFVKNHTENSFIMKYKNSEYIVLEGYNKMFMAVDRLKPEFGLRSVGFKCVRSDQTLQKSTATWIQKYAVYTMVPFIEGDRMNEIKKPEMGVLKECMKIGFFRKLFDMPHMNKTVIVNGEDVYSIDIARSKRTKLCNKHPEWIDEIVGDLRSNGEHKKMRICEVMAEVGCSLKQIESVLVNYDGLHQ